MDASGNLGIATTTPGARLDVVGSSSSSGNAFSVENSSSTSLITVFNAGNVGINVSSSPAAQLDVLSSATTINSTASTSTNTPIGVNVLSTNSNTSSGLLSYGVYSEADLNSSTNNSLAYGVFGTTGSGGGSTTGNTYYAIYGLANSGGSVNNKYWAGYFNGAAGCTANAWTVSDEKLKENIQPMSNALNNLMRLKPKTYNFRINDYPAINFDPAPQLGLIAQDVEQVFPGLVKEGGVPARKDEKGNVIGQAVNFKMLNYTGLIPVIISVVQQQQDTINKQQSTIQQQQNTIQQQEGEIAVQQVQNTQLQNAVNDLQDKYSNLLAEIEQIKTLQTQCCGNTAGSGNTNSSASDQPYLNQNTPNPFSQNTVIGYYLPVSASSAVITVYSIAGVPLQKFNISTPGVGQITISAFSLAPGTYQYDMTVNGKLIAAKKMIIVGQ